MGKLLDEILKTAKTREEWLNSSSTKKEKLGKYVAGKRRPLPVPFKKSVTGEQERTIQKAIIAELKQRGIAHWRIEGGGKVVDTPTGKIMVGSSMAGMADIIGLLPNGTFFAIEVKKRGGTISPEQFCFLDTVKRSGGIACIGVSTAIIDCLLSEDKSAFIFDNFDFFIG